MKSPAKDVARVILEGFDKHYRLFRETSARAKERFENSDWKAVREASVARIPMYDERVRECVEKLMHRCPDEALWPEIKQQYIALLYDHKQPECAETFFNSVACRVLDRRYYRNEYIFWRPSVATDHIEESGEPTYRCYFPITRGLRQTVKDVVTSFDLKSPFQDLRRDVRFLIRAVREAFPKKWAVRQNFQIQLLTSLFFRNKGAYIVGRAINGSQEYPFVVPLLKDDQGRVYVDSLLLKPENIGRVFSLARNYFFVDMEVPSAYVRFLKLVLPTKPRAEIYTMLGLQKQGKTLFFRDLVNHLKHSDDRFVVAPGAKGMVMIVFTLPSFPYVFKVIRDWFEPPKDTDRQSVQAKYLMVKYHHRAGRLADTLEYSHVAFPKDRFDQSLLAELVRLAPSCVEIDGEQVVIKHMYIERRMVPLDMYLQSATAANDEARVRQAVREYGLAIKELSAANIFAGDLLPKNFGVTRYGRVVFYDYDEICPLTDCTFRDIPRASSYEDEMASEPWYSVGASDVFPEELPRFMFGSPDVRAMFKDYHPELTEARFWRAQQERIKAGQEEDLFPYPEAIRFRNRFG